MFTKILFALITTAGAVLAGGPTDALQSQFEARLESARVTLQKPVTGPAEEVEYLQVQSGLMAAYSAWMAAEERDVHTALASLDSLRRHSTVAGPAEIGLSAARQRAAELLASAQAKVKQLRPLAMREDFIDAGESLKQLDGEIQAEEVNRKRRGPDLDVLDDAAAVRIIQRCFFQHQTVDVPLQRREIV